jgi:hypothetical protein
MVTLIHCTYESVKEHHIIAFITNIYYITDAYKNAKINSKASVKATVDNLSCC